MLTTTFKIQKDYAFFSGVFMLYRTNRTKKQRLNLYTQLRGSSL